MTPLHYCVQSGLDPEITVNMLVSANASLGAQDTWKWTPLHYAVQAGFYVEAMEALVMAGAPLDAQDTWGWTPLHHAVYNRNKSAMKALVMAGASLEVQDWRWKTPLDLASVDDDKQLLIKARRATLESSCKGTGISTFLAELQLHDALASACEWFEVEGATSVDDIVSFDLIDAFVDALDLKRVQALKLSKALQRLKEARVKEEL